MENLASVVCCGFRHLGRCSANQEDESILEICQSLKMTTTSSNVSNIQLENCVRVTDSHPFWWNKGTISSPGLRNHVCVLSPQKES